MDTDHDAHIRAEYEERVKKAAEAYHGAELALAAVREALAHTIADASGYLTKYRIAKISGVSQGHVGRMVRSAGK